MQTTNVEEEESLRQSFYQAIKHLANEKEFQIRTY